MATTVGGKTSVPAASPVVTAATYSAGQCVGGLLVLPEAFDDPALTGVLQALRLAFSDNITGSFKVLVFKAKPTASTFTDTQAASLAAADVGKLATVVDMGTPDTTLSRSLYRAEGLALPFRKADGLRDLFVAVVATSSVTLSSMASLVEVSAGIFKD